MQKNIHFYNRFPPPFLSTKLTNKNGSRTLPILSISAVNTAFEAFQARFRLAYFATGRKFYFVVFSCRQPKV